MTIRFGLFGRTKKDIINFLEVKFKNNSIILKCVQSLVSVNNLNFLESQVLINSFKMYKKLNFFKIKELKNL
jgi:hypothetical protein